MNKTKVVFFDIDHTLYDPVNKAVPQSAIEAIKALGARQDVVIAIATGRAFYMLDIIEPIKPYIDIYITINGQIILKNNKIIYKEPMSIESVKAIKQVFDAHKLNYGYIGETCQAIHRLSENDFLMFEAASLPVPVEDPLFYTHQAVYQMWAFADQHELKTVKQALINFQVVPWLSDGLDVILDHGTKKDGVKRVVELFNYPLEEAICFGDGDNDIEMLEYIPHSFAMGNAKNHIKSRAKYITTSVDEAGIKNALIKLGLIKESL